MRIRTMTFILILLFTACLTLLGLNGNSEATGAVAAFCGFVAFFACIGSFLEFCAGE